MPTSTPRQVGKNEIWTEHVRKEMAIAASGCKKKYTSNPFPSLEMNNGLGTRSYLHTEKVGHNFRVGQMPAMGRQESGCVLPYLYSLAVIRPQP